MKNNQVIKFIIAGMINTIFYFFIYSIFIFMGLDYKVSALLATTIGVFFSFKIFGKYVFYSNKNQLIFKFILIYSILYILNISLIYVFNKIFNDYYISGFMATLISAIVSFILNKFFVFKGE